jgi:hypothetical protein
MFRIDADSRAIDELFFWKNELNSLNKRFLFDYSLPQVIMYTDASSTGCGAWSAQCGGLTFNQTWEDTDSGKSSTWREMKGVALAIHAFLPRVAKKKIKIFTDNKGVVSIINKGSMNQELQEISIDVFNVCRRRNIEIDVQWVPRELNTKADIYQLSREIDFDDWGISTSFFRFMDNLWGPHTTDRFADNFNAKIEKFNSKFWCPGSSHVDAFSTNWAGDNNWLVPPISLVSKTIKHLKVCKARGTLIVPDWPSASFWPILFAENNHWRGIVARVIKITDPSNVFVYGRNHQTIFGSNHMKSHVLCVRVDASNDLT